MGHLFELNQRVTRSISSENLTGEAGGCTRITVGEGSASVVAADFGMGWKVNP